ncbi:MAG: diguanylate cyclase [Synergistaceae bacterium]
MKYKMELVVYLVILTLFSAITMFALYESRNHVADDYFRSMASGAEGLAVVLARTTIITDKEFEELKKLSFIDAQDHHLNKELVKRTKNLYNVCNIRYAYLMSPLSPSEVKYHVDSENAEFYGTKAGTPLNLVWLLDVLCDANDLKKTDTPQKRIQYYKDINRYSFIREEQKSVLKNQKSVTEHTEDEWGNLITAYAPVYTVEGSFVGMLGIDISAERYKSIWYKSYSLVMVAYAFSFFVFLFLTLWIYRKFRIADRHAKYTDALTGAYNRRYQEDIIPSILLKPPFRDAKYIVFVMVDIDYFKNMNDTYGHAFGDCRLKALYGCLKNVVERKQGVVVRWGGDEFMSALPVNSLEEHKSLLTELCARVMEYRDEGDCAHDVGMSISAGSHIVVRDKFDINELERYINSADRALYEAKNSGRNCFVVTER